MSGQVKDSLGRIGHGSRWADGPFEAVGQIICPYVSEFAYSDRHKGWFWEVTVCSGLVQSGYAKRRSSAVKKARECLITAYKEFGEEVAKIEGKEFNE